MKEFIYWSEQIIIISIYVRNSTKYIHKLINCKSSYKYTKKFDQGSPLPRTSTTLKPHKKCPHIHYLLLLYGMIPKKHRYVCGGHQHRRMLPTRYYRFVYTLRTYIIPDVPIYWMEKNESTKLSFLKHEKFYGAFLIVRNGLWLSLRSHNHIVMRPMYLVSSLRFIIICFCISITLL